MLKIGRGRVHVWLVGVAAIVLIAAHGVILRYAFAHAVLSTGLMIGATGLILLKHLGLFGPLFALLRRSRHGGTNPLVKSQD